MLDDRQMVKTFLDKKANDSVRVENEISAFCPLITDHAGHVRFYSLATSICDLRQKGNELGRLLQDVDIVMRNDRRHSCGRFLFVGAIIRTQAVGRRLD